MLSRANQVVATSLLMFSAQFSWAQADVPVAILVPDEGSYLENYDERIDVAGQVRAGLMYSSTLEKIDIDNLRLQTGSQAISKGERACFRVASRNGEFSATWRITFSSNIPENASSDGILTQFPSEHRAILEQLNPDQLVAIVSLVPASQECAVAGQRYVPSSWGITDRTSIVAYLNADSTEALIAGKTANGIIKENCNILPSTEENIAFDTVCTLQLNSRAGNSDSKPVTLSELVVLRKNFSTVMKKLSYPLLAAN